MLKRILPFMLSMVVCIGSMRADSEFMLHTLPRVQTLAGNTATFRTTLSVAVGFTASVVVSASTPSLPAVSITVEPGQLNQPYTDTVAVTVTYFNSVPGTRSYPIIIQAKNGPALVRDTVTLIVSEITHWHVFNRSNSPLSYKGTGNAKIPAESFALDRDNGIAWIALPDTLFRFDGEHWTRYPWPVRFNFVSPATTNTSVALDRMGGVWVTFPGLGIGRLHDGAWTLYDRPDSSTGLTYNLFQAIILQWYSRENLVTDSSGSLWLVRNEPTGGPLLAKFDGEGWQSFPIATADIRGWGSLQIDRTGNLWLSLGFTDWISKYDGTYWTNYFQGKDLGFSGDDAAHVFALLGFDLQNNAWLHASGDWMGIYDGQTGISLAYDTELKGISSIAFQQDGIKWFALGSRSGGLLREDRGRRWRYNAENSPLPRNDIEWVQVDNKGSVWGVTSSYELFIIDGGVDPDSLYDPISTASVTDARHQEQGSPARSTIQCRPNLVIDEATMTVDHARNGSVRLTLVDNLGHEVRVVHSGELAEGERQFTLSTDGLPVGMYYLRLADNATVESQPLLIVR